MRRRGCSYVVQEHCTMSFGRKYSNCRETGRLLFACHVCCFYYHYCQGPKYDTTSPFCYKRRCFEWLGGKRCSVVQYGHGVRIVTLDTYAYAVDSLEYSVNKSQAVGNVILNLGLYRRVLDGTYVDYITVNTNDGVQV